MRNLSADDLLSAVGLERRRDNADYLLPALGLFGAGLIVGAGLGLLFAPKAGSELRRDLSERVGDNLSMRHLQDQVRVLADRVQSLASRKEEHHHHTGHTASHGGGDAAGGHGEGTNHPKA